MRAYVTGTDKTIGPFGDHPGDCLILNRRLRDHQQEVLRNLKLEPVLVPEGAPIDDPGEHVVIGDSLLFTPELLAQFIRRSRELRSNTACALKRGIATLRSAAAIQDVTNHPDSVEYPLRYSPDAALRGETQLVVVDPDEFHLDLPMPEHMFGSTAYRLPLADLLLVGIDHWVNLWTANVAMLLAEGARLQKASNLRRLGLALKARSTSQWKVLAHTNAIGRNCDIHPTAYIEGSTIGDNVVVGAGSVIRESMIGDGTFIQNNVVVELSVVGENCNIRNGATAQYSCLYPGAFTMTRLISASLCGRDTFLGDGVVLTDFRLDGETVSVVRDGEMVDTENRIVGCCLGHSVYLGAGCVVAPGRAIPNGWQVVPGEQRVITLSSRQPDTAHHRIVKK